ncbi:hypothetical protein [Nocardioides rotundus]|uniref:hypothetical protein n=1 Tax=Nocardioides rotundus TaxID=1774216 RepID=UPI001CBD73BC|nr:hypothetical protein [Nocardioides rotundus]
MHVSRRIGAGLAAAALAAATAVAVPTPAQAIPTNSHCGTEPGNNNDAFVNQRSSPGRWSGSSRPPAARSTSRLPA